MIATVEKKKMVPWNKGIKIPVRKSPIPFSSEHRAKLGAVWKGKKRPESTRIKMSIAQKGKIHSEQARLKNRLAHLGFKHTDEAKRKIGLAQMGDKNRFWLGGKMKDYSKKEQIRKSIEYKLWRDACFARDGYVCQVTGQKGRLVVHHIYNFNDFPELRTAISNGITLSVECHKEFHKIYGVKNNTREQLEEFINNKTK